MSDLKRASELEQLQYFQLINEANNEEEQRIATIQAEMAKHGTLQSGATPPSYYDR